MAAAKKSYIVTVSIDASPTEVWKVMRDVERWNQWTPSIRKVRRFDSGEFTVGSRALVFQPGLPPALWRVTALEPDRGFTWVSSGLGFRVTGVHHIDPAGQGSSVTLSITYEGLMARLMVHMLAHITQQYLDWEAAGLKKRCESPA